jgi:hypothetical protein
VSFFAYMGGDWPGYPPPQRVYAWVDSPESSPDGFTRLECVDADWADELPPRSSLAFPETATEAERRVSMMLWREPTRRRHEGRILEMRLSERTEAQPDVLHYMNLWSPPVPRSVELVRWPKPRSQAARRIAGLTDMGRENARPSEIREALEPASATPDAVAIYDVGQGSCSALIGDGVARAYFDVGGGALADAHTFPRNLTGICTTDNPPVVLSHWHFDHWSLARRFVGEGSGDQLLARTWIVPRQPQMRPTGATLLGLIRTNGRALVRDAGAPEMRVGAISLHPCTGKGLNNSGVAMVVHGPGGATVLLPGDARYKHIAGSPTQVTSLVAAHHGGHTGATAREVPVPDGLQAGRLVFSCGFSNSYGHPLERSLSAHRAWGSQPELRTSERGPLPDPQHIHLYWEQSQTEVQMGCGGTICSLAASRR